MVCGFCTTLILTSRRKFPVILYEKLMFIPFYVEFYINGASGLLATLLLTKIVSQFCEDTEMDPPATERIDLLA